LVGSVVSLVEVVDVSVVEITAVSLPALPSSPQPANTARTPADARVCTKVPCLKFMPRVLTTATVAKLTCGARGRPNDVTRAFPRPRETPCADPPDHTHSGVPLGRWLNAVPW